MAVASSGIKENVFLVLDKLNIKNLFKIIITAGDIERVKPFPDIYNKSCDLLGYKKDECVAIEDSETGLEAAKAAGIKCIVVPCEFTKKQDFSAADKMFKKFNEITKEVIDCLKIF